MGIYKMNQKEVKEFEKLKEDWSYIGQVLNWILINNSDEFHKRLFDNKTVEQDNKEQLAFSNAFMGIDEIEVVKEESDSEIVYKYLKSQYETARADGPHVYPMATFNNFAREYDSNRLDKKIKFAYVSLTPKQEIEVLSKFAKYVKERNK